LESGKRPVVVKDFTAGGTCPGNVCISAACADNTPQKTANQQQPRQRPGTAKRMSFDPEKDLKKCFMILSSSEFPTTTF
jgi:hypothetical protein